MDRMTVLSRVGVDGTLNICVPMGLGDANKQVQVTIEPTPEVLAPSLPYSKWLDGIAGQWQGVFLYESEGSYETRETFS